MELLACVERGMFNYLALHWSAFGLLVTLGQQVLSLSLYYRGGTIFNWESNETLPSITTYPCRTIPGYNPLRPSSLVLEKIVLARRL